MRIDRIELFQVSLPLREPWTTSFGTDTTTDSVMVRMCCSQTEGWGEAAPLRLPTYGPEYTAGAFRVVRDLLAPLVVGRDVDSAEELQQLLAVYRGNNFAKASLDLAWWDLNTRLLGKPLWRAIGGTRQAVAVGEAFGIQEDTNRLLARIRDGVGRGYTRVKIKYGPGSETAVVRKVREEFPSLTLHIDCNAAYTLDSLPMFRELDQFNLAMIEQPLSHHDIVDHARLQEKINTPICLDESIATPELARQAIEIGACRWINIKHGRLGGLTNALRVHEICAATGTPCWIGSMLDSAIGTAAGIALASLSAVSYPSDLLPSDRFFERDICMPGISLSGPSRMTLSEAPGIGVKPDREYLDSLTVDRATIE